MGIRAVAFDVDGTLYPNRTMYLKSVGFGLRHARLMIAYGRVRRAIRSIRPIEDFRQLQARMLSEELSVTVDEAARLVHSIVYNEWEEIIREVPAYPHIREMILDLRARGIRTGVVSDFPVERKLSFLGLGDLWDCAFSAEEVKYLKPNREPFEHLAECLVVPVSSTLYVGNSYRYDVLGAKNAGMLCAHIAKKPERNSVADVTFSDYRTLHEWILSNKDPRQT
ncbi:MAG TPA: HAD family hydrolase [Spirochaetia bacterium]|nr:HAD family hydrolase [Spirochaetia bacterium]